jgi:predicted RNA-binding Zn-ribbon protein involved in translation (DUF1610 family)
MADACGPWLFRIVEALFGSYDDATGTRVRTGKLHRQTGAVIHPSSQTTGGSVVKRWRGAGRVSGGGPAADTCPIAPRVSLQPTALVLKKALIAHGTGTIFRSLVPNDAAMIAMTDREYRQRTIEAEELCPRCKAQLRLVGVERAEKLRHDLYTFECPECGHLETRTVRVH